MVAKRLLLRLLSYVIRFKSALRECKVIAVNTPDLDYFIKESNRPVSRPQFGKAQLSELGIDPESSKWVKILSLVEQLMVP